MSQVKLFFIHKVSSTHHNVTRRFSTGSRDDDVSRQLDKSHGSTRQCVRLLPVNLARLVTSPYFNLECYNFMPWRHLYLSRSVVINDENLINSRSIELKFPRAIWFERMTYVLFHSFTPTSILFRQTWSHHVYNLMIRRRNCIFESCDRRVNTPQILVHVAGIIFSNWRTTNSN